MRRFYPALLTSLFVLLLSTCARAQDTVAVMNFDGTAPEMAVSTDVAFFDNNSDGFFGIHDANGDPNDGTPTDTGDGNASDVALVDNVFMIGDFLFVNDLDDEGDNGAPEATVTFGPVTVTGETSVIFSFQYEVDGFDNGDDVFYTLVLDGTDQTEVQFVDGDGGVSSGTVSIVVPDGTNTVGLKLRIDQNGDDAAGFDNFLVTANNTGLPCGITSFGPEASASCNSFSNDTGSPDGYTLTIPYAGIDADAVIGVSVDGTPVTFDASTGDDPTTDADGTLVLTSGDFLEGTSYEVTLTDPSGQCNFTVSGSVATDACVVECDLDITLPDDLTVTCTEFTDVDNADAIMVEIDFTGFEPGTVVSAPGLTIAGDDPAVDDGGTIIITGLVEGGSYVISISGGDCTGNDAITIPVDVPANFCTPSALVINEVLADPGSVNDANNDGVFSGADDEFIELFNTGTTPLDLSGYTISEGAGVRYTFADGFILQGRASFVLFGGGTPNVPCLNDVSQTSFIGLNNSGDVVTVRNAQGLTVAQMSYGSEGNNDQSLALNPDGDVVGGYVQHTTIPNPSGAPLRSSACFENDDPQFSLPVELLAFTATTNAKSVTLNWSTANEIANDRFVIERSRNGVNWEQLGSVPAGGRSNNAYVYVDEQPLDGQNVYRLRQLDLDGSFALYGPVSAAFVADGLSVYPNPVAGELRFNRALETGVVSVLDGAGRRLVALPVVAGRVDVRALSPGLYLLQIEQNGQLETLRFVKR